METKHNKEFRECLSVIREIFEMCTIRHKHAQLVKRICEENGYYDSLRGKQPSEACIEAARRKRASGFQPMKALKQKNPRKYRRVVQQLSEARQALDCKAYLEDYFNIKF